MTALDVAQQYYASFNRKDWPAMLALIDPDIQHDANQGGSHYGLAHFQQFLQHMDECYDETLNDQVFLTDPTGQRVATEFVVHGTYKKTDGDLPQATGQRYILPAGAFLDIADGKIRRITTYYNLPLWLTLIAPKQD